MSQTAIEKMTTHITQLAAQHRITVTLKDDLPEDKARAEPHERLVVARTITRAKHYATVLHEIGHIIVLDRGQFPRDTPSVNVLIQFRVATKADLRETITIEEAAWAVARDIAILWTPEMEADAQESLATYYGGLATMPDLPNPTMLFAMSLQSHPLSQQWARKRMLETLVIVARDAEERERARLHVEQEWASVDIDTAEKG